MSDMSLVCCDQRPAAPDRICSVTWCLAQPIPGGTLCAIHKANPNFKPEELDAKAGHFEVKAEWLDRACKDCDGSGEVDHHCDCEHCTHQSDDCDACDGSGDLSTCSLCGFQTNWTTNEKTHEADCWGPAPRVRERAR